MAHPRETRREHGKLWHLEDSGLPKSHAEILANHLRNTEDKYAHIMKRDGKYQVWWSKR